MDLRNCPQCGKLFAYDGTSKVCNVCRSSEENDFEKVRDYLWDNPNATIEEVHTATEVERELIIKFVREGRLVAEGIDFSFMIECERCGLPIPSGRFCNSCQQELVDGFNSKEKKKKKDSKKKNVDDKMFTANRVKDRKKR
ncbi:TIGR03826 family flagellar region protein [Natronospora cellulosivora (SeqCode)]